MSADGKLERTSKRARGALHLAVERVDGMRFGRGHPPEEKAWDVCCQPAGDVFHERLAIRSFEGQKKAASSLRSGYSREGDPIDRDEALVERGWLELA